MKLKELIEFFDKVELTNEPIRINQAEIIRDQKKFVESHISYLKSHSGNVGFKPYYNNLLNLYKILSNNGK